MAINTKKILFIASFFLWMTMNPTYARCLKTHASLYNYKGKYVKKSDKFNTDYITPTSKFTCNELINHFGTWRKTGHDRDENASSLAKLCDNDIVIDDIWKNYQLIYLRMYLPKKDSEKSMVWKAIPIEKETKFICTVEGEKYISKTKFRLQTPGKDEIIRIFTRERKIEFN
tara:strand:- start:39 stop:554 length:516 start_codon:yes stop_codon:yes gene_type:complete